MLKAEPITPPGLTMDKSSPGADRDTDVPDVLRCQDRPAVFGDVLLRSLDGSLKDEPHPLVRCGARGMASILQPEPEALVNGLTERHAALSPCHPAVLLSDNFPDVPQERRVYVPDRYYLFLSHRPISMTDKRYYHYHKMV